MRPDFDRAATAAMQMLIDHNITETPIMPLPILKNYPGVRVISFAKMANEANMERDKLVPLFVHNQDAATFRLGMEMEHVEYVVAYNMRLQNVYDSIPLVLRELIHTKGHDSGFYGARGGLLLFVQVLFRFPSEQLIDRYFQCVSYPGKCLRSRFDLAGFVFSYGYPVQTGKFGQLLLIVTTHHSYFSDLFPCHDHMPTPFFYIVAKKHKKINSKFAKKVLTSM